MKPLRAAGAVILLAAILAGVVSAQEPPASEQSYRFRSAVELINVTVTVTDHAGRFVAGLTRDDFRVYDDGEPQQITHFSAERAPVSLGIVLDTSGSMEGEKMLAARRALRRFLFDLLGPDDEIFLYRFDSDPELVQGWTSDRHRLDDALERIRPAGGTALFDAVADALPMMRSGRHRKKAMVIISDGNDTSSGTTIDQLRAQLRESEVLVYAIGIDAPQTEWNRSTWPWRENLAAGAGSRLAALFQRPRPRPFPIPGQPPMRPPTFPPSRPVPYPTPPPTVPPRTAPGRTARTDRVNVASLRDITDPSGGRTEIVRTAADLDPATAGIADELSKQYYLGYPAAGTQDGRWHSIRVEVRSGNYRIRARNGYLSSRP